MLKQRAVPGAPRQPSPVPAPRGAGEPPELQDEPQQLRRKINSRERKRMQDLNMAMDALREVILPYSAAHCQHPPGRKLSKTATLLLARNYILLLGGSLQEMRRVLGELSGPRLLLPLFAGAGSVFLAPGGVSVSCAEPLRPNKYFSVSLEEQLCSPFHLPGGAGLCSCALCKLPLQHFIPSGLGIATIQTRFSK